MPQRPQRKRPPALGRSRAPLVVVALALFAAGLFFGVELAKPPPPPDFGELEGAAPTPAPGPMDAETTLRGRRAETVGEKKDGPIQIRRQLPPGGGRPRVSIVIDDLGRSLQDVESLAGLDIPLTYSVLPFETLTAEVVAELRRLGVEFLCHLPMEAKGGANPGPGAVLGTMDREAIVAATQRALDAVPGASGVNNHMGSLIASRPEAMSAVLSVVADHDLYYLDSRTSADTLGYTLARELGLPAGERQVFLDATRDPELIREQFQALLAAAEERGGAIAIAHPHPETLEILEAQIPAALERGIEFVRASALMDG